MPAIRLGPPARIATWSAEGRDLAAVEVGVGAVGEAPAIDLRAPGVALETVALRWDLPMPPGARVLGDHWERGYGDLEWRGVIPERVLPWYALVHDPASGRTMGFGVETGAGSFASWRVDHGGVTLVLDLRCGGEGVRLGGRTLRAAVVHAPASEPGESPFAFGRRFCAALCRAPRLTPQPIYGGNDWYYRYGEMSAETVKQDAGLVRELSPDGGNPPVFVTDAGWFPARGCDGGPYDHGHEGFPDLPGLAAWMRGAGVRPGIWIRPLLSSAPLPQGLSLPPSHPLGAAAAQTLDPSVPEALAQVEADMRRLGEWGYEVIKHDFSTYDLTGSWGFLMGPSVTRGGWAFADRSRTTAEIVLGLYRTLRQAAGDAALIGCNTVGHLGAGLFEVQRTGDDTSGHHWERTRRMGVNTLAFRMVQQGTFFAHDADCVGLRPEVPWERNRQWLDLLARSGTPLFVSAGPDHTGPEQRAALRRAFARAAAPQPPAEPLDWMETACPRHWRFGDEALEYDWVAPMECLGGCPG